MMLWRLIMGRDITKNWEDFDSRMGKNKKKKKPKKMKMKSNNSKKFKLKRGKKEKW
jgi:hypothetical protein